MWLWWLLSKSCLILQSPGAVVLCVRLPVFCRLGVVSFVVSVGGLVDVGVGAVVVVGPVLLVVVVT